MTLLTKGLGIALAVLVTVAILLWGQMQIAQRDRDTAERDLKAAQRTNAQQAETIRTLNKVAADNRRLVAETNELRRAIHSRAAILIERTENVRPEDDGPVAPVLRDALIGARQLWNDAGDQGSSGSTTGPSR